MKGDWWGCQAYKELHFVPAHSPSEPLCGRSFGSGAWEPRPQRLKTEKQCGGCKAALKRDQEERALVRATAQPVRATPFDRESRERALAMRRAADSRRLATAAWVAKTFNGEIIE